MQWAVANRVGPARRDRRPDRSESASGVAIAIALCGIAGGNGAGGRRRRRINREIRPILSEHCFACHGPDSAARKAELRLDSFEGATEDRGGYAPIVPGDPDASELIYRVESEDELDVMPPPSMQKPLSAEQKDLLRRWVASGAAYRVCTGRSSRHRCRRSRRSPIRAGSATRSMPS